MSFHMGNEHPQSLRDSSFRGSHVLEVEGLHLPLHYPQPTAVEARLFLLAEKKACVAAREAGYERALRATKWKPWSGMD